jgi:hypothetical protein
MQMLSKSPLGKPFCRAGFPKRFSFPRRGDKGNRLGKGPLFLFSPFAVNEDDGFTPLASRGSPRLYYQLTVFVCQCSYADCT